MNKYDETVTRRRWFPEDASYTDAIASVEDELRDRHDIEEIDSVAAETVLSGDWRVTVVGVLESSEEDDE
ncbi:hypothetical protein [Halorussus marinus]|uniref:hypothetical protein n=1 Tax=Halorussus marinus TaxID=2505976 RepID=UPI0010922ECD|nr:hypothetical protein [Halorussus marinus]